MNMFAFFLTTFIRRARIAILAGIFMFVIGLLFESFVFSGSFIGYIWWAPSVVDPAGWKILVWSCRLWFGLAHVHSQCLTIHSHQSLFPFFNFGHMFLDISTLTTGRLDTLTQASTTASTSDSHMVSSDPVSYPNTLDLHSWAWISMEWFVYSVCQQFKVLAQWFWSVWIFRFTKSLH